MRVGLKTSKSSKREQPLPFIEVVPFDTLPFTCTTLSFHVKPAPKAIVSPRRVLSPTRPSNAQFSFLSAPRHHKSKATKEERTLRSIHLKRRRRNFHRNRHMALKDSPGQSVIFRSTRRHGFLGLALAITVALLLVLLMRRCR